MFSWSSGGIVPENGPDERPAVITRMMRVLLLSAMVTSSLGFAALPAAPSAALAGGVLPARGGSLLAYDIAGRISPRHARKAGLRSARELGSSSAWTHKYPALGSHVSVGAACILKDTDSKIVRFGKRRLFLLV